MEASTLQPPASLAQPRIRLGAPLLRLRSDEQLVALFRAGHDEAFRVIHDRYHKRLFAYARQMLPARQDAEDALQDVFVRAYAGLRASDRDLALRAWLFRVAHNRCVDELRKPAPPPPEVLQLVRTNSYDPLVELELRESLRRLVNDIRRLPEQQRSALLMRELAGLSYAELASSLGVSVGAVKSLLVRARLGLAEAAAARDTACVLIREQLVEAHDRGIRPTANTRKHVRDCPGCKSFRGDLRGVSRQLAATAPTLGPLGFLAQLLGISGGGGAAGGAGGGAALVGGGTTASAGGLALSTGHVATLLVAAVATAGGAVEIQHTILPSAKHAAHARAHPGVTHRPPPSLTAATAAAAPGVSSPPAVVSDRSAAFAGSGAASSTATTHSATTGAATDADTGSATGTGSNVARKHTSAGSSSTTTTATNTTGASTTTACATPATSPATTSTAGTTTAGSSAASGSGSGPTADTSPGATTTATAPSATTSCAAAAGSSAGSSAPSSAGSTTGTTSATGTTTGTASGSASAAHGSGSAAPVNSEASTGSASQSSSNVATG